MKLRIIEDISYAHRLHNYDGKCNKVHGHTGKVVVEVSGSVNKKTGLIMDFKLLKQEVKKVLDEYDHFLLLSNRDNYKNIEIEMKVVDYIPTAENIARDIAEVLMELLTEVKVTRVEFWESPGSCAIWEG